MSLARGWRVARLEGFRLSVDVLHGHLAPEDRMEDSYARIETFLVDVAVTWRATDAPSHENAWNCSGLAHWLTERQGMRLFDPMESLADDILGRVLVDIEARGLEDARVRVRIGRPDLFDGFGMSIERIWPEL
jgi:hypothetical protein